MEGSPKYLNCIFGRVPLISSFGSKEKITNGTVILSGCFAVQRKFPRSTHGRGGKQRLHAFCYAQMEGTPLGGRLLLIEKSAIKCVLEFILYCRKLTGELNPRIANKLF